MCVGVGGGYVSVCQVARESKRDYVVDPFR